ncbi:MAG: hypothetical protein K9L22_11390 [Methylococcaceae bacterium]|nr:hypothetical protein [Methylococcaceae bacterium]
MPDLARERIRFIAELHEVFLVNKGFGAFAYVSINDVLALFEQYLESGEPAKKVINRYVHSI